MNLAIIRNISREGPGLLATLCEDKGYKLAEFDLSKNESPDSIANFDAVIMLGGPDSVNDNSDKIKRALELTREATENNIPYLGICLGMQLLAKVAGGKVVKLSKPEIGFFNQDGSIFEINLTESGEGDPIFDGLGSSLQVFHLHGETIELDDKMQLLATGKNCANQVLKVGDNAYGLQCHFELTSEMFELWVRQDEDLKKMDQDALRTAFATYKKQYTETGIKLFSNFLDIVAYNA